VPARVCVSALAGGGRGGRRRSPRAGARGASSPPPLPGGGGAPPPPTPPPLYRRNAARMQAPAERGPPLSSRLMPILPYEHRDDPRRDPRNPRRFADRADALAL